MSQSLKLQEAILIKRYKRFLADVKQGDNEFTLHCPNTGAMTGCAEPGWKVYYSLSDNPKRKYPGTLEYTQNDQGELICVNTARANGLVEQGIANGVVTELADYSEIKREARFNPQTRFDLKLTGENLPECFVEVKSVTLKQDNQGYFPDAVTTRGQKHLQELIVAKQQGYRAVLLFCVQHMGINSVKVAEHVDPEYAKLLNQALVSGVEVLCYKSLISADKLILAEKLAFTS